MTDERNAIRRLALGCWLIFVVACVAVIARTHFTADLSAFLPSHPTSEQAVLVEQLRDGPASRLILIGVDGDELTPSSALAAISKALARRLRADRQFASISNGEPVSADKDRRLLFDYRYLLSPAVTPEHFTVGGLKAALADSVELLSSSAGTAFQAVFPIDPTGELVRILDALENGSAAGGARTMVDGVWMSKPTPVARPRALLLAQTRAAGSDIDSQESAVKAIRAAFVSEVKTSVPRLLVSGPGVFAVESRSTIKSEAARLSGLGALIVTALLLTVYRSVRALALSLLPMLTGALAGIAAVSLGFGSVHGITLGFGVTLIGEAVDYAIYLFVQGRVRAEPGAKSGNFWRTIRLGVATSAIGFSSLLFSGFTGLAQLGLFSIAGVVTAAMVTRWVLPVLIPENFSVRATPRLGQMLAKAAASAPKLRWLAIGIAIAAGAFLIVERDRLWNRELAALSPVSKEALALDAQLRSDLGAPDVRALIAITAPDAQAALAASEHVAAALDPLVASGDLGGYDAPSRYLPSIATQAARQAALPDEASLRANFAEAGEAVGLANSGTGDATAATVGTSASSPAGKVSRQAVPRPGAARNPFEGFFLGVARSKILRPLTREDLEGSSLALGVDALLHRQADHWTALVALRAPATPARDPNGQKTSPSQFENSARDAAIDGAKIGAALAASAPVGGVGARYIDLKLATGRLYRSYMDEAIRMSLAGGLAIVALLAVVLRSPARLARVCAPLFAAVVIVAAALVARGQTLTLFHLVGLMLIVAVGSNYALFFDRGARDGHPVGHADAHSVHPAVLTSLLFANLTAMAGFGLLAFSKVPVLNAIGSTVGPGAFLVLILSAILARGNSGDAGPDDDSPSRSG